MTIFKFGTVGATALALLLSAPAFAQGQKATPDEATDGDAQVGGQSIEEAIAEADAPDTAETDPVNETASNEIGGSVPTGQEQADTLVATVGDAEIRGSDVMTVIGMLPPRLQSQSAQMLVPIALEQLILRELILERARSENLAQDPEVAALVEGAAQGAEEDAMVKVWIDREMAEAVTDEAVRRIYDTLQPQGGVFVPPIEELRLEIEQHLRQQAMQEIRNRLRRDAEIVFFGPGGQPISQTQSEPGAEPRGAQGTSGDQGLSAATSGEAQTQADADTAKEPTLAGGGWIGVQIQNVTPQIARALQYSDAEGALIAAVEPGGPAAEAGIEPGSVVIAVDDNEIEGPRDLVAAISEREDGVQVTLTVRTGPEQTEQVAVTIGERQSPDDIEGATARADQERPRLGLAVATLSPEVREELRLPADLKGLIISRVEEGSPAAQAEITEGDVIVSADRTPVTDVEALREAAATARDERRPLLLRVYKDGAYSYIPVELGSA